MKKKYHSYYKNKRFGVQDKEILSKSTTNRMSFEPSLKYTPTGGLDL